MHNKHLQVLRNIREGVGDELDTDGSDSDPDTDHADAQLAGPEA